MHCVCATPIPDMPKHRPHLCKYEASLSAISKNCASFARRKGKQRQQSSVWNSRIWSQFLGSQNEVFGAAHHYLRVNSGSKNFVSSCTMDLLAATETWIFALVFFEWKLSFENENIDACRHSLQQTISDSSPFPQVHAGFYFIWINPCTRTLWWLCTSPPTKVVSRNLSDQCAKDNFPSIHRHSLLWSWLNLREYCGDDFCSAKKQSHWDDFFAQFFLDIIITNLHFSMRRLLSCFCANIPVYLRGPLSTTHYFALT